MAKYVYITQSTLIPSECKVKVANVIRRQEKGINLLYGEPTENPYRSIFICEIQDGTALKNDFKKEFFECRLNVKEELYFLNEFLLDRYVNYIKTHPAFKEVVYEMEDIYEGVTFPERDVFPWEEEGYVEEDAPEE